MKLSNEEAKPKMRDTLFSGVIGTVVGTVLGSFLATFWTHSYQLKELKIDTMRRIAGYRYQIAETSTSEPDLFYAALNEAVIVFHDSPKVLQSLNTLRVQGMGRSNDNLLSLFRAIFEDLGLKFEGLNDAFFLEPLTPSESFRQRQKLNRQSDDAVDRTQTQK